MRRQERRKSKDKFVKKKQAVGLGIPLCLLLCLTVQGQAAVYHQGFEVNTSDWTTYADSDISRVASGAGMLNVPSADGAYHAEITNDHDAYQTNYGSGGYSYYGGRSTYMGPTTQSLDIYIDTSWAAPARPGSMAFMLDMSPSDETGAASNYAAESNFRFYVDGTGSVNVNAHGEGLMHTITTSGWYTFEMVFSKGATATDPIQTLLRIYDSSHSLLADTYTPANTTAYGNDYQSQYLGSGGYAWLTVWQNGFAGDVLAIDNAQSTIGTSNVVPEPASSAIWLAGGMLGLALAWRRRRRTSA